MATGGRRPGGPRTTGTGPAPPPADGDRLAYGTARSRWVIAATVLGSGIAALDATVVGIALPSVARSFHCGLGPLQWVVTGYTLTLAAFLLLGGSLGDRFGRRRLFTVGVVWFVAASAVCGTAPDVTLLIAARAVQGVGAALLTPASLAILEASFRPDDRSRAIGAWSALGGLATAAGPLIGGYLIGAASWRWVFFINLPIGVVVLALATRHVPETSDPDEAGIDPAGALLAVAVLASSTFALIEGPTIGWSTPAVIVCLVAAVAAGPAFVAVERRLRRPMLPLGLFAARQFSAANAVTFVVYGALGGALFLLPVELQDVVHYSPLAAGTALLPVTAIMLCGSTTSARLAARIGPRLPMGSGPMVAGVGLLLLGRATRSGPYAVEVLPALACFGVGLAITVAPLTATALGAAPPDRAGVASAVNTVVARAAGLLAVAVLPLVSGIAGVGALAPARLAAGFRTAAAICGAACAAGGLLAFATIRNPAHPARSRLTRHWHCGLDATPAEGGSGYPGPPPQGPARSGTP